MCGRYTREYTWREVHEFLDLRWPSPDQELPPSYNVAPTQRSAIVRVDEDGERRLHVARWGLVPPWSREPGGGGSLINARADGVATKPAFRAAFKRRRCVVPASAFYEWQVMPDRDAPELEGASLFATDPPRARRQPVKRPWYIHRLDGRTLCLAGLWERWTGGAEASPAAVAIDTFTIVTTDANVFMRPLHDRMPVVLERDAVEAWLSDTSERDTLLALLRSADEGILAGHPVSPRVGSPREDDPGLIAPAPPTGA